jgi:hypothetical protein
MLNPYILKRVSGISDCRPVKGGGEFAWRNTPGAAKCQSGTMSMQGVREHIGFVRNVMTSHIPLPSPSRSVSLFLFLLPLPGVGMVGDDTSRDLYFVRSKAWGGTPLNRHIYLAGYLTATYQLNTFVWNRTLRWGGWHSCPRSRKFLGSNLAPKMGYPNSVLPSFSSAPTDKLGDIFPIRRALLPSTCSTFRV